MTFRFVRVAAMYLMICTVLMLAVFSIIVATGDGPWRATEATVVSSSVESTRVGQPTWSLDVEFTYVIDGKQFGSGSLYVFHDVELTVTESEQALWPKGRVFTIYTRPSDPEDYSLAQDGGREAFAVVVSILVPAIVAFAWIGWEARRKWRRESLASKDSKEQA